MNILFHYRQLLFLLKYKANKFNNCFAIAQVEPRLEVFRSNVFQYQYIPHITIRECSSDWVKTVINDMYSENI